MVAEIGWQLGAVVFLPHQRLLCRNQQQVYLEPKVFLFLQALLQAEQHLLDHQQMLQQVWQGRVVSDSAMHRASSLLRKAFAELDPDQPYLETLPKVGYRLVAAVSRVSPAATSELGIDEQVTTVAANLGSDLHDSNAQVSQPRLHFGLFGRSYWRGGALLCGLALLIGWFWFVIESGVIEETPIAHETSVAGLSADMTPRQLQAMTAEDGMESQLSVSLQAQQFLYVQQSRDANKQWWLQQYQGTRQPLLFTEPEVIQAVLSPDAKSIVYQGCQLETTAPTCQLLWRAVDNPKAELLLSYPHDSLLQLSWQPDGQAIFFRMREHKSQPYQIYRYLLRTRQLLPLTLPPPGQSDIALAIDPAGQQLVVLRYEQQQQRQVLWYRLKDFALLHQQSLPVAASVLALDHHQRLWFDCPDGIGSRLCQWNANSASVAPQFEVPGAVLSLVVAGEQLWLSSGQQRSQIWRQPLPLNSAQDVSATASFATTATVEVSSARLELMPRAFGQDLIFLSNRHGRHQIWRRHANGHTALLAQLPAPAGFVRLSRSADGQYVAFSQHGALYLLQIDSALCWQLLGPEAKVAVVNWHQHQLIFSSERSGDWQLWRHQAPLATVAKDGIAGQCLATESKAAQDATTDLQQLTQQGGYSGYIWQNQLLYSKYHQDGLFQLDLNQPQQQEQQVLAEFDRINWLNWQLLGDTLSYFKPRQGVVQQPLHLSSHNLVKAGAIELVFPLRAGFIHQYQRTDEAIWWVQSTEQQADILRLSTID